MLAIESIKAMADSVFAKERVCNDEFGVDDH